MCILINCLFAVCPPRWMVLSVRTEVLPASLWSAAPRACRERRKGESEEGNKQSSGALGCLAKWTLRRCDGAPLPSVMGRWKRVRSWPAPHPRWLGRVLALHVREAGPAAGPSWPCAASEPEQLDPGPPATARAESGAWPGGSGKESQLQKQFFDILVIVTFFL